MTSNARLGVTEKRCSKCREVKPVEEFHKSFASSDFRAGYCKVCANANTKAYVAKNKEKHSAYLKDRYQRRKEAFAAIEAAALKRGVSIEELARELAPEGATLDELVKLATKKERAIEEKSIEELLEGSDWEASP